MGLAEPRKRLKLSNDPNNTKWTKDTTGFGHKIMTSQGWAPGDYLGAKDAPHAEFHTEANASHIRVMIKDDNLGIGAKKGSGVDQGECVGLDVFQTLLGRLNATDEDEYVREQKSREDLKRAIYTEKKWGSIRFVSGGVLIGDKIQDLIDGEAKRLKELGMDTDSGLSATSDSDLDSEGESDTTPESDLKDSTSKKSTEVVDVLVEALATVVDMETSKSKLKKKRKLASTDEEEGSEEEVRAKDAKKGKKNRKSKYAVACDVENYKASKNEKKETKEERKARKSQRAEEKAAKKERKKVKREEKDERTTRKSKRSRSEDETTGSIAGTATPASGTASPRPILLGGRHAVRAKNIEQKRLAAMSGASLSEIFMIKS